MKGVALVLLVVLLGIQTQALALEPSETQTGATPAAEEKQALAAVPQNGEDQPQSPAALKETSWTSSTWWRRLNQIAAVLVLIGGTLYFRKIYRELNGAGGHDDDR